MTPEGKVKKMVKDRLKQFGDDIYQHWPVLNGMGAPELDCNLIVNGRSVSIECKAPGERMTPRQRLTTVAKRRAGGLVFEVDSEFDMNAVVRAINHLDTDQPFKAWDEEQLNIVNKQ